MSLYLVRVQASPPRSYLRADVSLCKDRTDSGTTGRTGTSCQQPNERGAGRGTGQNHSGVGGGQSQTGDCEQPGVARQTVRRWEKRFVKEGTKGLEDAPRSGRPRRIGPEQIAQIIHKTTQETPADSTRWSTRCLALVVKVSASSVGRIWRSAKLKVHRVRTFRLSQ